MNLITLLNQKGKLTQEQTSQITTMISEQKTSEIDSLMKINAIKADELAEFISHNAGMPLLDLERVDLQKLPPTLVDALFLKNLKIVPLARRNDRLVLATSNPLDKNLLEKIEQRLKLSLDIIVVNHEKLQSVLAIDKDLKPLKALPTDDEINNLAAKQLSKMALKIAYEDNLKNNISNTLKRSESDIDDSPAVKFLQKIFAEAIKMGASDLHFEPFEKDYRIRFRIDGMLHEVSKPPIEIKDKMSTRIKVLSKLDISEKRVPQDGRMKISLDSIQNSAAGDEAKSIDFRVSTLPTIFGEKVVMRILEGHSSKLNIDALGYEEQQKKLILDAVKRPYGMILVTGPTGSGKTVSLYTFLSILNNGEINISTAEDPVEIQVHGINQVNINEKAGLNFASALRSFLRQDPDIIMVGEIRDLETADIAIKAAQTGHLVFSTLHTNDAPSTLMRLANMGVASFNIASSIHLITAQRLPRRLCKHCKVTTDYPEIALEDAGFKEEQIANKSWQAYKAVGCSECNYTGYKGRVGIYQIMPISEDMQRIILAHGSVLDISNQASKEGVLSLRESGLLKVMQGLTSLEEILSVTNS
ncbi:MAG: hypothetical protein RLZZ210_1511 [Pseudomonadota bacterium]|jgi:type IV pilus assembly protein PilB